MDERDWKGRKAKWLKPEKRTNVEQELETKI